MRGGGRSGRSGGWPRGRRRGGRRGCRPTGAAAGPGVRCAGPRGGAAEACTSSPEKIFHQTRKKYFLASFSHVLVKLITFGKMHFLETL